MNLEIKEDLKRRRKLAIKMGQDKVKLKELLLQDLSSEDKKIIKREIRRINKVININKEIRSVIKYGHNPKKLKFNAIINLNKLSYHKIGSSAHRDILKSITKYKNYNRLNVLKTLKKNHPKFINFIKLEFDKSISLENGIYLYMHRSKTVPKCKECDRTAKFINMNKGYFKFCSKACYDLNKLKIKQKIYGHLNQDEKENYRIYYKLVWKATESQKLSTLNNISERSKNFHLNHKYSIFEGFKQGVPPAIIGNICNLEILPSVDNIKKSKKCSISKERLFELYFKQQ